LNKVNFHKVYLNFVNILTGVDWKSLVFPACLPITTDYFPDEVTLQSYYLFSNYNLLPDYVNAEVALQRAVYRQPLSALEVFYQMICQRLSQVKAYNSS